MAEEVIIRFSEDQFIHSSEPYDYLVQIESATERDHEIAAYRKFAQKNCGISAAVFKDELKKAEMRLAGSNARRNTNRTDFPNQPMVLNCPGYTCDENGVWADGGNYGPICICPQPIMPIRQIVNYDTGEHKTEVAYLRGKEWRTLIVPNAILGAATKIVQPLRERGVIVDSESARGLVTYFSRMESANIGVVPEAHSATRMGWIDDKRFLPFEGDLIFDGESSYKEMYDSIHEHGDRQVWFDLAEKVRHGTNKVTKIMLAASFASVLIYPLKKLPFIVHCWTDKSGTGKTVAVMLATSVWANPAEGKYWKSMNTTDVGVEMTSGFLGSLPLCLDELCLKDQKSTNRDELEAFVYKFCEGIGRTRGTRTGGIQQQKRWNCCAITTGETPIISDAARAGAINRVIDLADDEMPLFEDNVLAANTVRNNYGFAGKIFLDVLRKDGMIDKAWEYQEEYYRKLLDRADTTEKQAMAASVILAADRIAAECVFHDSDCLHVDDIAQFLTRPEDVDINLRAYNWLMDTITMKSYMIMPVDDYYNGKIIGKFAESDGKQYVCIIRAEFNDMMRSAGFNDRAFLSWARKQGLIKTDGRHNDCYVRNLTKNNIRARCVCIEIDQEEQKKSIESGIQQVDVDKNDFPF